MTLTLLLDLDDTLLESSKETFLPAYFRALANHMSSHVPPEPMLAALNEGIRRMLANEDPSRTLQQVFEDDFYPRIGHPKKELSGIIQNFYDTVFPTLRSTTKQRPGAHDLVAWALAQGHQVAIATDPLFPRQATYERVRWAGLEPERFDLISSFESFHFSKSHPAYLAELIGRLGWPDRPVLMAGNDVARDLAPARELGMATYHVNGASRGGAVPENAPRKEAEVQRGGDLIELRSWLESARLEPYVPAFQSPESILAVLEATPGVLQGLTSALSAAMWAQEPSPEDWAMIELVCHLRDTEREVHHVQIKTLRGETAPFVPRPDAAVWAKQRRYLNEDGPAALREFTEARIATLGQLKEVGPEVWSKAARHAIFGPTNFMEVVGFMADHDRLHLQQAWSTLAALR
jgi:FMN phosphatase YigB (HAD superfamily)